MHQFIVNRLKEWSTWEGAAFIVVILGARFGMGMTWGDAAAGAGSIIGAIKMVKPDAKP